MNLQGLRTKTLENHPSSREVQRIIAAALKAVDPATAVACHLERNGDLLLADGHTYNLSSYRRVWLVGAGKAGAPMARAAARILGRFLSGGIVVVKESKDDANRLSEPIPARIVLHEAGHPLPDKRGEAAARQILNLLKQAGSQDLVICLISGGGSALMTAPVAGISLDDLQQLTQQLLDCGASIDEINILRKHLDMVKGGGLARQASRAHLLTLILSDVVGDPLDVIASGPTVADTSTFMDAVEVLSRYRLQDRVPPAVMEYLQKGLRGQAPETPKPGDSVFERVHNLIIGSNILAAQAAITEAHSLGFNTLLLTTYLQGEARLAGRFLAAIARQMAASGQPLPRPACIVVGGETTVTIQGEGLGGRNQEAALGAVREMAGLQEVLLVTLATDGDDGPTAAAGAMVSGETLARALALGLKPEDYLARNDSFHFFEPLGDLLLIGQTHTNVNDLAFLFAF